MSPACRNCYIHRTLPARGVNPNLVTRTVGAEWTLPYRIQGRVQVCPLSDFFLKEADVWRKEAWDLIQSTPHLTYQILTKRANRIRRCLPRDWGRLGWSHVWMGVTSEIQDTDWRIDELVKVPATYRFISAQPLLGRVDYRRYLGPGKVVLVLAGCEEGGTFPRHTDASWLEDLKSQCFQTGAEFFLVRERDRCGKVHKQPYWNNDVRRDHGLKSYWPFSEVR